MDLLLEQDRAAEVLLQATPRDVVMVYGFSSETRQIGGQIQGNDPALLQDLSYEVSQFQVGGNTALFDCVESALRYLGASLDPVYNYSVIALTDGHSNEGADSAAFADFYRKGRYTVPVYGIAFGDADLTQLETFKLTGGDVYDGRGDAANAFLMARGNN
jgi:hypothetical protein